jgi:N-acyl homoserine lactone hydrolase
MRVRGFCCGWLEMDYGDLIVGEGGRIRLPVPCYLIEHAGSVIVFDSGLHPDVRDERSARHGILSPHFDCHLPDGAALHERLAACGIDPSGVDYLALSHLHFDHVGGATLLSEAELVLQRAEWEAAVADAAGETYLAADIESLHDPRLVEGEWDLLGDGRVRLIPSAGHTAGHQSLHLRTDGGGEIVLCGDACYMRRSLDERALPGSGYDLDAQRRSFERLRDLESAGASLIFGHDPAQWPAGPGDDKVVELSSPRAS